MMNGSKIKDKILSVLDAPVDIKQVLLGHYFSEDVQRCLNNKISFGLRSGNELDSIIVFNVSKLALYDYSRGRFSITDCKTYARMLNYLKWSLETHRIYLNCEESVQFLRNKNILP